MYAQWLGLDQAEARDPAGSSVWMIRAKYVGHLPKLSPDTSLGIFY